MRTKKRLHRNNAAVKRSLKRGRPQPGGYVGLAPRYFTFNDGRPPARGVPGLPFVRADRGAAS